MKGTIKQAPSRGAAKAGQDRALSRQDSRPSNSDKEEDDHYRVFTTSQRPTGSEPCQDNGFCLEDEAISSSIETLLHSLTVTDPHQKGNPLVFVSHGFEALSGYSHTDLLGANCRVLQGKTPDKAKTLVMRQGLHDRQFTSLEISNFRKDGRSFQNLLCMVPVMDGYDNLLYYAGVQCDLDEKRRKESDMEHFSTKWREQVHYYLTAFMVTTQTSSPEVPAPIRAVNAGFTALTGYTQADVAGCSCLCLCGVGTNARSMRKWVTSQAGSKAAAVKMLCYRKDGSPFWGYILSCPLQAGKHAQTQHTLHIVMDVTSTRLKRVGKYVLGKVIGNGAYGIVRLGKVPLPGGGGDVVAIKAVDASRFRSISEIEQIQEEMSVLSSLKHPHIIRLLEIHFINSVFFLVMEFASGGSLVRYTRSHEHERLPEQEAHRIFMQILSALDYCHRRRVIHRDLKPENILLDDSGNIKIADFGLAAVTAPSGKGLTQQCGTPEFAAPEIISGKEYDGPSVDIWSMGVILYEALAGSLPFTGPNQAALFKAIQKGVYPPLPPHISPQCCDLIKGMLRVDAHNRLTMEDIMTHPWCHGKDVADDDLSARLALLPSNSTGVASEHDDAGLDSPDYADAGGTHNTNSPTRNSPMHRSLCSRHSTRDGTSNRGSMMAAAACRDELSELQPLNDARDHDGGTGLQGKASSDGASPEASMLMPAAASIRNRMSSSTRALSARGSKSGTHDSLRLVIDDGDAADPITAAIMRAQMVALGIVDSSSGRLDMDASLAAAGHASSLDGAGVDADIASGTGGHSSTSRARAHQALTASRDLTPLRAGRAYELTSSVSASGAAPSRMALASVRRPTAAANTPLPPLSQTTPGSPAGAPPATPDISALGARRRAGALNSDSSADSRSTPRMASLLATSKAARTGSLEPTTPTGRRNLPPITRATNNNNSSKTPTKY